MVHGSGHALGAQRDRVRGVFEIVLLLQIGNEARLNRSPSQPFLRLRAGSRAVHTKEESDPAKMIGCFLARLADERYVQASSDNFCDFPSRHALVGHAVIPTSSRTLLEHEPVKMSSIQPMHGGSAVEPVSHVCRNALFTCDADQAWHEAMITVAVDRWRKPQHRCADSACRQRTRRLLRLAGEAGIGRILFCCERASALNEQGPRSDDQRAIRARERAAESLDGALISLGGNSSLS